MVEQPIREAPEFTDFFFYRTKGGAEIDLVIIAPNGALHCVEIKYSLSPVISKGFYQALRDLEPAKSYVITPAGESYERSDGIRVCALADFLEKLGAGLSFSE